MQNLKNKNNIECQVLYDEVDFYVITDPEGRVWPCNHYLNKWIFISQSPKSYHNKYKKEIFGDPVLEEIIEQQPDWNLLSSQPADKIFKHEFFTNYVNHTGWNSDSPPPICLKNCGKK
jgi:hypothetical protein